MAVTINGKAIAAEVKQNVAEKVAKLKDKNICVKLAVILVGENPASAVYVNGKAKDCAECGIESLVLRLADTTTENELLEILNKYNLDSTINGILVQLPLPKHINEKRIIDAISPDKDVDGFTPINVGRMVIGEECFLPCTPAGCMELIKSTGTDINGKDAVVIGRSNIVGKPAALLLSAANATVTICHSRTKNLAQKCAAADIIVAAVGKEGFVTGDMVKEGAIVIDVGINRNAEGKLCGDVDFAAASEKAAYITPVPGGVGLMTRAMLMKNTLKAAEMQNGILL
ncbi:MAG: bifunctional methylenetetrahydrofolate dehydrogenase/methenyltetrahydrofolate cyclohydrolase FolD [Oscillospiraceae bacterium]